MKQPERLLRLDQKPIYKLAKKWRSKIIFIVANVPFAKKGEEIYASKCHNSGKRGKQLGQLGLIAN